MQICRTCPKHRPQTLASLLVREIEGISLEQLGKVLDRDPSGLTKLANRLETKCNKDPLIGKQVQKLRDWIVNLGSQELQMSECQA